MLDYDIYAYDNEYHKELLYTANDKEFAECLSNVLTDLVETGHLVMFNGAKVNFISVEHEED